MKLNFLIIALSALVPLLIGMIWYNQRAFGKAWISASGVSPDAAKHANMPLIFGVTYVVSFLLALGLNFMVIHQWHMFSILTADPDFMKEGSASTQHMHDFMAQYGQHFRSFKHGVLHGFSGGLLIATPVMVVNALFEGKNFRYIAINCGYWIVSMMLMGGIICAYA